MQRGNERSDCSLTPLAGNGLRSAARSKAPSSCLGGVRGVFWSPTRRKVSMKHSLAGAEAPLVHLSYNHPKRAPATILSACHSYIFRTLALLGEKEGLPEPPRTLAVTESGRQDSNLRPSAPKARFLLILRSQESPGIFPQNPCHHCISPCQSLAVRATACQPVGPNLSQNPSHATPECLGNGPEGWSLPQPLPGGLPLRNHGQ